MQKRHAGVNGFSTQNIWRMKRLYETYCHNQKLSALLREISWTNNLTIMVKAKTDEEREFYLTFARQDKYSSRELDRQINALVFERDTIKDIVNKPFIGRADGLKALRDSYSLEFIDLPKNTGNVICRKQ